MKLKFAHVTTVLGCLTLGLTLAMRAPMPSEPGAQSPAAPAEESEQLLSFAVRARHEFSNGSIARTTVLIGQSVTSSPGGNSVRFVGSVTSFEIEGEYRGELASLKQVSTTDAEAIGVQRSLPQTSIEPATPVRLIGTWTIRPKGSKSWGTVWGPDDVTVLYAEEQH